jgi:hypothetical protein
MTKVNADTIDEFIAGGNKLFGGTGMGETTYKPPKANATFKDGKFTKLKFDMQKIDTEYAEVGGGNPDDNNKAAIKKAADMAKDHEEAHKASYEKTFKDWNDKTVKELMKKSYDDPKAANKDIQDALADLKKQMYDACVELHKKEGKIVAKKSNDGTIDVSMTPSGPAGCK